jgi:hypothetical protein
MSHSKDRHNSEGFGGPGPHFCLNIMSSGAHGVKKDLVEVVMVPLQVSVCADQSLGHHWILVLSLSFISVFPNETWRKSLLLWMVPVPPLIGHTTLWRDTQWPTWTVPTGYWQGQRVHEGYFVFPSLLLYLKSASACVSQLQLTGSF